MSFEDTELPLEESERALSELALFELALRVNWRLPSASFRCRDLVLGATTLTRNGGVSPYPGQSTPDFAHRLHPGIP